MGLLEGTRETIDMKALWEYIINFCIGSSNYSYSQIVDSKGQRPDESRFILEKKIDFTNAGHSHKIPLLEVMNTTGTRKWEGSSSVSVCPSICLSVFLCLVISMSIYI